MKPLLKIIALIFIVCFIMSSLAFASPIDKAKGILVKDSIENSAEKDIVLDLYNNSFIEIKDDLSEKGIKNVKNVKNNKMFKVYKAKDLDIINSFNTDKKFSNLISSDYSWEVPIYDDNGKVVSTCNIKKGSLLENMKNNGKEFDKETQDLLKKEEGKWSVALIGNYIPLDAAEFLSSSDKIENFLIENNLRELQDIKVVVLPYYTYVLYIKNNDKEFGIPYNLREDLTGITNGKLYEMGKLMEVFSKFLNSIPKYQEGVYSGISNPSVDLKAETGNNVRNIIIVVSFVLLGIVSFVVLRRRRFVVQ